MLVVGGVLGREGRAQVWAGAPQRGRRLRTAGCSASAGWRPSPIPSGAVRARSSQATLALLEPQATPTSCCHSFRRERLRMYWHTCWRVRSRCVRCPALEAHPTQHAACHNCAARMPRSLLPGTGLAKTLATRPARVRPLLPRPESNILTKIINGRLVDRASMRKLRPCLRSFDLSFCTRTVKAIYF